MGYARAVRVGPLVVVAGTTAPGDDLAAQTREVFRRIETALTEAGAALTDVVRTRMYVTDIRLWEQIGRAHGEVFAGINPATTMVQVVALIDPAMLVEIEAEAVIEERDEGRRSEDGG